METTEQRKYKTYEKIRSTLRKYKSLDEDMEDLLIDQLDALWISMSEGEKSGDRKIMFI